MKSGTLTTRACRSSSLSPVVVSPASPLVSRSSSEVEVETSVVLDDDAGSGEDDDEDDGHDASVVVVSATVVP